MTKKTKTQTDQFAALREVGALAFDAGTKGKEVTEARGNALNLALVALTAPGMLNHAFPFDVRDKSGAIVESAARSLRDRAVIRALSSAFLPAALLMACAALWVAS